MSNRKTTGITSKLWVKILCIALAALMIGSIAYIAIVCLLDAHEAVIPAEKIEQILVTSDDNVGNLGQFKI